MLSDLTPDWVSDTSVGLLWTATADDGLVSASGAAREFDMRYSSLYAITTETDWNGSTQAPGEPAPGPMNEYQGMSMTGLQACTNYHFAIRARDDNAHISALHPDVLVQTMCYGGGGGGFSARRTSGEQEAVTGGTTRGGAGAEIFSSGSVGPPLIVETNRGSDDTWQVTVREATPADALDPEDTGAILSQVGDEAGDWVTLGRHTPTAEEHVFGICGLRDRGRYVFPAGFEVGQAASATSSRSQALVLASTSRQRDGQSVEAMGASSGSEPIRSGEHITLVFREEKTVARGATSWYLLLNRRAEESPSHRAPIGQAPERFAVYASQPEQFRGLTRFYFDLPSESRVNLEVFDLLGRKVATVVEAAFPAGSHTAEWSANDGGGTLRPGVYVYRMTAGTFRARGKVSVIH